jgi:hypothetical protein
MCETLRVAVDHDADTMSFALLAIRYMYNLRFKPASKPKAAALICKPCSCRIGAKQVHRPCCCVKVTLLTGLRLLCFRRLNRTLCSHCHCSWWRCPRRVHPCVCRELPAEEGWPEIRSSSCLSRDATFELWLIVGSNIRILSCTSSCKRRCMICVQWSLPQWLIILV